MFRTEGPFSERRLYIEDDIVRFTCIGMSSLVGRTLCSVDILYHICKYNHIPVDEPSESKHVEDNVKTEISV
jgi:hypothetical protein